MFWCSDCYCLEQFETAGTVSQTLSASQTLPKQLQTPAKDIFVRSVCIRGGGFTSNVLCNTTLWLDLSRLSALFMMLKWCVWADRPYPTLCRALRSHKVQFVACGEDHTAVLTRVCRFLTVVVVEMSVSQHTYATVLLLQLIFLKCSAWHAVNVI